MSTMRAFRRLAFRWIDLECIAHLHATQHEHLIIFFDFAARFRDQPSVVCQNSARGQRATQRSGQSARRRRYEIIERRGVRLVHGRIRVIVFCDL